MDFPHVTSTGSKKQPQTLPLHNFQGSWCSSILDSLFGSRNYLQRVVVSWNILGTYDLSGSQWFRLLFCLPSSWISLIQIAISVDRIPDTRASFVFLPKKANTRKRKSICRLCISFDIHVRRKNSMVCCPGYRCVSCTDVDRMPRCVRHAILFFVYSVINIIIINN